MTHRLFIGLSIPAPQILELQSRLSSLHLPIEWQEPDKFHLTLNFLGRVPDDKLSALTKIVTGMSRSFSKINLEFPFLETLYQRHDPTLIYLAVSSPEVIELQKNLSQALSSISLPQPHRFMPHVTIGKFKKADPIQTKRFAELVNDFDYQPIPSVTVGEIILYKSFLSRSGSHYQKMEVFPFQLG